MFSGLRVIISHRINIDKTAAALERRAFVGKRSRRINRRRYRQTKPA
jgi:hypothetical protein